MRGEPFSDRAVPVTLPLLPLGSWFPQGSWPRLPCGECATGELQLGTPSEIDVSARYRDHEAWEPEWITGHFSVQAECSNRECRSIALVAGKMKVDANVRSTIFTTRQRGEQIKVINKDLCTLSGLHQQNPQATR